ncbi:MAG: phage holin family protein [Patescibacteria group bacterium]|jgi:putative membrane protein
MKSLTSLLINTIAVFAAAYILPGVSVQGFLTALVAAVVLAILNLFLKPVLIFFTLPATLITLGLFIFVINAFLVLIVAWLVPGFAVNGFFWALLFSLVFTLVKFVLEKISEPADKNSY